VAKQKIKTSAVKHKSTPNYRSGWPNKSERINFITVLQPKGWIATIRYMCIVYTIQYNMM